jgi:hexokinase
MVFSVEGGISLMVEHQFSKLRAGVRFSYPAQQSETDFETARPRN